MCRCSSSFPFASGTNPCGSPPTRWRGVWPCQECRFDPLSFFIVETNPQRRSDILAKAQKWGNSIAVRIPKPIADDAGIHEDNQLDISVVEGAVVLSPRRPPHCCLEELLEGITGDNLHSEADFGPPVGNEALRDGKPLRAGPGRRGLAGFQPA